MIDCFAFLKKQPAQQRSLDSVNRILDSSRQILAVAGYEALSTNRIAQEAGVNVASVYQYFPDKEAILCTLYLHWVAPVYAIYDDMLAQARQGLPFVAMARQLENRQSQLHENTWGYQHMAHLVEMLPALRQLENEHVQRSAAYLADLLSAYRQGWPRAQLLTYGAMLYRVIGTFNTAYATATPGEKALILRIYRRTLIGMLRIYLNARTPSSRAVCQCPPPPIQR